MKDKLHKMFSALLMAGCFIAFGGAAVYAQGRDSALRTGGSNSGRSEAMRENRERREAEKRTQERRSALLTIASVSGVNAPGNIGFADMARALGVDEADLKDEYNDDHKGFSWLEPVGYFTVKMLVNTARRERDNVEISRRDLLKSMVKGTLPVQYLVNKGFTAAEAEKVIKLTDQRLTEISKGVQK